MSDPEGRPQPLDALARQSEIYLDGLRGQMPQVPTHPVRLREAAERVMEDAAYAYVAGGAGMERTMHFNREAFDRWRIVPRVLRNVSQRDLSVELFGRPLPAPLLFAPIGVLEMAHPQADVAVARAAASLGLPMIFSSQASEPMEECAAVMGDAPHWFQLYWSKSDALVESFVRRAEACGCEALVVTLDTTMLGWRPRDLDLAYLPFLRGRGIAQYVTDPVFLELLERPVSEQARDVEAGINLSVLRAFVDMARAYPGGVIENLRTREPLRAVQQFITTYSRPSITWDELPFLRDRTDLPILLKGVLHPDDARRAVNAGVDGVIVSNHGGRQVDGAVASLDALERIVEAAGGELTILFDSGIRTGADVFKALALGAQAVCLGRPYVYGLALAGSDGVRAVARNVISEFELTMGLSGCIAATSIDRAHLQQAP